MFCTKCGKEIHEVKFCPYCGAKSETGQTTDNFGTSKANKSDGFISSIFNRAGKIVDEDGNIDIKLKDLFSKVFAKHTQEEVKILLLNGAEPYDENGNLAIKWPYPWLFSRIFIFFAAVFLVLYICADAFNNVNMVPGLIFIGSLVVPFSILIFFWESNVNMDVNILDIVKIFFIGGVMSLLLTLLLDSITSGMLSEDSGYISAVMTGVVEETAKFAIALYFIRKIKCRNILSAVVIGASVGAGFAVFESAGYAFSAYISALKVAQSQSGAITFLIANSLPAAVHSIFLRAFLAGGGHVVWAALSSAAYVIANNTSDFSLLAIKSNKFLRLALVPVVLHSIWDSPIATSEQNDIIKDIILVVIAWIFILIIMNAGLKQYSNRSKKDQNIPAQPVV